MRLEQWSVLTTKTWSIKVG